MGEDSTGESTMSAESPRNGRDMFGGGRSMHPLIMSRSSAPNSSSPASGQDGPPVNSRKRLRWSNALPTGDDKSELMSGRSSFDSSSEAVRIGVLKQSIPLEAR